MVSNEILAGLGQVLYFLEIMMDRFPVSKYSSARSFERSAGITRMINYVTPMRGGWRL